MKMDREFTCEIFKSKIYFYAGMGYREAIGCFVKKTGVELTEYMEPLDSMSGCLLFVREHTGKYLLWIEDDGDYYALVHEVFHLVFRIFETYSIPINNDTQEVFANYQEYWVRKIWKEIGEQGGRDA